jgi:Glycosyl hydrolase family 79 C-terminal beta domain
LLLITEYNYCCYLLLHLTQFSLCPRIRIVVDVSGSASVSVLVIFLGSSIGARATAEMSNNVLSISPLSTPPLASSQIIGPSYAGFGIEPSNLYSYTGGSESNVLSLNLLNNLANYTGAPPHLRIGGNTQDYMIYVPSHDSYDVSPNPNPVGQGDFPPDHLIFGPRYFEVLDRFPTRTPITYGLSLAYSETDYIDRIVASAEAARTGLNNVQLVSFEIGNEPDLYLQNGFRTGQWDGQVYTNQWLDRASAVYQQVLQPNGIASNFFEPACTASTIGTSFMITDLASFGITDTNGSANSFISSWNQHNYYYYIGVSPHALTMERFTDLSTTITQFRDWKTQVQQAFDTGYSYDLREMGVVGPIGYAGITDTFAASLWTLNFFLYAAGLNISSVQMHMTDNSNASAWQPIPYYADHPFIRPNYYGFAAMAQLIGRGCSTQVIGIPIETFPDGYQDRIGIYNTYQEGKLAAIVFINTVVANASDPKGSLTIDISLPDFSGQTLHLSYLTADGADSTEGTTWNGISYDESGDGSPTIVKSDTRNITIGDNGSVSVEVRDSQAVVANIGSVIGSTPTATNVACNAVTKPEATSTDFPVSTARSTSASSASSTGSSSSGVGDRSVSWNLFIFGVIALIGLQTFQ